MLIDDNVNAHTASNIEFESEHFSYKSQEDIGDSSDDNNRYHLDHLPLQQHCVYQFQIFYTI